MRGWRGRFHSTYTATTMTRLPRLLFSCWVTACSFLLVTAGARSRVAEYDLIVKRETRPLDGVNTSVITVNGQIPGPEIRVRPGAEVIVRVFNINLEEGTSLHWHGQHMRNGDLYDDGVPYLTQCEIRPGEEYTYRFTVNDIPGTYLYHGHQHAQRGFGLVGPFIIESPGDTGKHNHDAEYNALIQDWYHAKGGDIVKGLGAIPFEWAGDPQSILINGVGRFNSSFPPKYSEFKASSGQTVLIRLANVGLLSYLNLFIEGHKMTVIEADGHPVEPFEVPNIDINIGERYSVLVHMDQPIGIYPIHAAIKYRNERVGQAMLVYEGEGTSALPRLNATWQSVFAQFSHDRNHPKFLNSTEVRQAGVVDILPGEGIIMQPANIKGTDKLPGDMAMADKELILDNRQARNKKGQNRWSINFNTPSLKWYGSRSRLVPTGSTPNTWRYPYGTVLDIVFQNYPSRIGLVEQHPWHLHGHSFYVLGSGPGRFNRSKHERLLNLRNPPLRDTVTMYPNGENSWVMPPYIGEEGKRPSGWVVVRVRLDNPGTWLIHCHITWHHEMEMLGYIITEPGADNLLPETPVDFPLCMASSGGESGAVERRIFSSKVLSALFIVATVANSLLDLLLS